ncbi:TPA: hypothetical protein ACHTFF_003608 [Clostridioides difficile]|uniref:Uncharacterized protein n=5 Tax=root TaxID=1 RepID=A0A090DBW4_9CAUD|nr:hypothetical protein [Clostridioides difficile]YP_009216908.1 hypothetical protein AVU44_gp57 [Clostridium phage phiCDHM19]ALP03561.1 hypothetical protein PCZ31_1631 [Clostridioides difficile]EGT4149735.1 hypothetical protein [Clostridioides difficile]EGT5249804.1 hypothetical protein [Clostridioides difficile]EGT5418661.1 hypothetical protein [Clostridioides difficile]ELX4528797.1 hypothetical protein [Clostridioides difficile]
MKVGDIMQFSKDILHTLTLEILKEKYDFKNSSEEELLKHYHEIFLKLSEVNNSFSKGDGLSVFKQT